MDAQKSRIALQPLRVEASHRKFYRIVDSLSALSWVAMESPPKLENNKQFVALANLFQGLGTPAIFAVNHDYGFFLMEDLGEHHLHDAYGNLGKDAASRQKIINLALDALLPIQRLTHPQIPPYDESRLIMEFDLCAKWFAADLMSMSLSQSDLSTLAKSRSHLLSAMLEQPQACVHRDYHCRNILLMGNGGSRRIGIVDFQDALIGPALYDVASLLQDCYAVHERAVISASIERFAKMTPLLAGIAMEEVLWWHDACAIQRQIKAVGIFARLHLRDGKSSHLHYIPSVLTRAAALAANYKKTESLSLLLEHWAEQAGKSKLLATAASLDDGSSPAGAT